MNSFSHAGQTKGEQAPPLGLGPGIVELLSLGVVEPLQSLPMFIAPAMWALYEVLANLPIEGLCASGLCVTGGVPKMCVGGLGVDSLVAWVVLAPALQNWVLGTQRRAAYVQLVFAIRIRLSWHI
jgi:hypothetical protein